MKCHGRLLYCCKSLPSIFPTFKKADCTIFALSVGWFHHKFSNWVTQPHTDQVPQCTIQYHPLLTKCHHTPTSTTLYWPHTTKYQRLPLSWTNIKNDKQRQTANKINDERQKMTNDKQHATTLTINDKRQTTTNDKQ